ncbi:MAG: hypothetical protein ACOH2M_04890 [Cypionkella sp.]
MPAIQVLQSYLDTMSAAAMTRDWESYRAGVSLPFTMITETSVFTITTEAELQTGLDAFYETLRMQKVTDYVRLAETAAELGQNLISGRYITHLLAGANRVVVPYRSNISLRLNGNRWQAITITNSMTNMQWPIHVPRIDPLSEGKPS